MYLKEIDPWEGFLGSKLFFKWCKEEKYEENRAIFKNVYLYISKTAGPISFKSGM